MKPQQVKTRMLKAIAALVPAMFLRWYSIVVQLETHLLAAAGTAAVAVPGFR